MKKFILFVVFFILSGCIGISPQDLRNSQPILIQPSALSRDSMKICLLDKLDAFRPDRISVNDFSYGSEILVGAVQAGRLRNYYLFLIKKGEIQLFKYNAYFAPLSLDEASNYVVDCTK